MKIFISLCVVALAVACASKPAPSPYAPQIIELKARLAEYRTNLESAETAEDIARWSALSQQAATDLENASRACEIDRALRMQYQPSWSVTADLFRSASHESRRKEVEQIQCR